MPMATPEAQRQYQREWLQRRRAAWFEGKTCIDCGTTKELQLDHVDPRLKVDHKVWSWSATRRAAELAKCVARCKPCHARKSAGECVVGEAHGLAVVPTSVVKEIRQRFAGGERQIDIARDLNLDRRFIHEVVRGKTRYHGV